MCTRVSTAVTSLSIQGKFFHTGRILHLPLHCLSLKNLLSHLGFLRYNLTRSQGWLQSHDPFCLSLISAWLEGIFFFLIEAEGDKGEGSRMLAWKHTEVEPLPLPLDHTAS